MSLTKFNKEVQNISLLSDYPNSNDGLTSSELKEKFDQAGVDLKDFINSTLTSELDSIHTNYEETLATKDEVDENYLKKTDAEETYLTINDASDTYLTQADADTDYLKKNDASVTYLTKTDAQSTYDTINHVTNTYATKQALAEAQMGAIVDQSVTREKLALELQDSLEDLEEKATFIPSDASVSNKLATQDSLDNLDNTLTQKIDNIGDNLATVATTGDYEDLINKPFIPPIPYIEIHELALANKTITATNVNDSTDVRTGYFDNEGTCLLEVALGTYNLLAVDGLDIYSATITTQQKKITVTLSKSQLDPSGDIIYGYEIDEDIADPSTRVTYTDDILNFINAGFTIDWIFENTPFLNNIKPCRLNSSGTVTKYLQKNDFTKDVDGNSQTLSSGDNVMIEFPKFYWYVHKEGSKVIVKISNHKVDENYKALAHTRGTVEVDNIYIGAYLGYNNSNVLKSWSGKTPTANKTSNNFRIYVQANGTNYQKMTWYMYTMLQLLFVLKYKSTDCQTALGKGYTKSSNSAVKATGGTETKGMDWGEINGTDHCKFLGIEDAWGNLYQFIDGLYSDGSWNAITTTGSFTDFSGSNAVTTQTGISANVSGFITKVQGTTETPFLIKEDSGSETTHYCDYGDLYSSCLPVVGGRWDNGGSSGLFGVSVSASSSYSTANLGSRVCYL